jgi:predicted PurR-regulated permease PerM
MQGNPSRAQILFLLTLIAACIYLIFPFLPDIMMGAILAVLTFPMVRVLRSRGMGQALAALLTTLLTCLVFFLPLTILVSVGARTAAERIPLLVQDIDPQAFQNLASRPELRKAQNFLRKSFGLEPEAMQDYALSLTQNIGERAAREFGAMVTHIPVTTLYLLILILSLFFFLHTGPDFRAFLRRHSMFDADRHLHLEAKFVSICKSLVLAALLIGILQATIFSVVCLFLEVQNVSIIGMVTFLMSFIPIVGSAPFTIGLAIYYLVSGASTTGMVLLGFAIFISTIDNLIRPLILRQGASMNPVVAMLAILGGLRVFGFTGIFLGPLLIGILIETYRLLYTPRS